LSLAAPLGKQFTEGGEAEMSHREESPNEEAPASSAAHRREELEDDVDAILDRIPEVLEENAEEYVRSYVQTGGQGWSDFLGPEFYFAAASAGVLGNATYDLFKRAIDRMGKALRQIPGPMLPSPIEDDPDYEPSYEENLRRAWGTANRVAKLQGVAEHSNDEATALHWVLFTIEMRRSLGSVNLGQRRYERLARASSDMSEPIDPSELAQQIIDLWLREHELQK
jgi:ubiquitin-like protein Pup